MPYLSVVNCTQGQGMSWDESLHYAHQLLGVHPWTGYMIEVVALQETLKEACDEIASLLGSSLMREPSKRIAHLNAFGWRPPTMRAPAGYAPEVAQGAQHD